MISTTTLKYLHNFGIHGCIFGEGTIVLLYVFVSIKREKKLSVVVLSGIRRARKNALKNFLDTICSGM